MITTSPPILTSDSGLRKEDTERIILLLELVQSWVFAAPESFLAIGLVIIALGEVDTRSGRNIAPPLHRTIGKCFLLSPDIIIVADIDVPPHGCNSC